MTAPDKIFAWSYEIVNDDGSERQFTVWDDVDPYPILSTEYTRTDLVQAAVAEIGGA